MARCTSVLLLLISFSNVLFQTDARILTQCEAVKELDRNHITRSLISNFVCVMKSESNFNTSKKTGPGHKSSYSYGIFQISSDKWCNAYRPGNKCNVKCDKFLDDDITDDIECAKIILNTEGFKNWKGWVKNCKNGKLPNISSCIKRRDLSDEEWEEENWLDEEWSEDDLFEAGYGKKVAAEIKTLGDTGVLKDNQEK